MRIHRKKCLIFYSFSVLGGNLEKNVLKNMHEANEKIVKGML